MPDNKNRDTNLDPDSMIWTAKSLQRVVKELERDGSEPTRSEVLLFEGTFAAIPVLLSLATEIALKAWQCREQDGKHDRGHDLLKLFDGLKEDTRRRLEAKMQDVPLPGADLTKFPWIRKGLHEALRLNRNAFVDWRYLHEARTGRVFETAAIKQALTVIVEAYDNMPDE